jgi:uncharacterized surface protein with fasciclin (FAS1) repeats
MKTTHALCACIAITISSLAFAGTSHAGGCMGAGGSSGKEVMSTASATSKVDKETSMDIVQTAIAAGSFKTLVAAVQAAGLVETLQGKGPFTVFAPTDEAFAKLPKGTVEDLLKPENKAKLVAILTYHVVAGRAMAADVTKAKSVTTVQGQDLAVLVANGKAMIGNANLMKTDVVAGNGVIHVIDTVLLPKQ